MNNLEKEILKLTMYKPTDKWWDKYTNNLSLEQQAVLAEGLGYMCGSNLTIGYIQGSNQGYKKGLIVGGLSAAAIIIISEIIARKIMNKRRKTNE